MQTMQPARPRSRPIFRRSLIAGGSLSLLALSVLLGGCGGSGSSSGTGGSSTRATVFLTDNPREEFAHVWATIYKVELTPQDGSAPVTVFEDTSGRQIDLKTLRDASGERYAFLSSASVPSGVYTGATVTVGPTMQLMKNGETVGDPLTVDTSLPLDAAGHPVLSLTFRSPKTLGGGTSNIVVDFNLARFIVRGSNVLPALNEGEGNGLHDPRRHEKDEYHGTVSGLSGASPNLTFTLNRGRGKAVTVTTTASTALFGETALADGAVVDVTGTLDPATQTIVATQVEVRSAETPGEEAAGACTPQITGTASTVDASTGTFTLTPGRAHGIRVTQSAIAVTTDTTTVFRDDTGATVSAGDFFTALTATSAVRVRGTFNPTAKTLAATDVRVFNPANDGGWEREPRGPRGNKGGRWGNGAAP